MFEQNNATVIIDERDDGLRKHMLRVYNYMIAGLGLTGVVAWYIASNMNLLQMVAQNQMILSFAVLGFALGFGFIAQKVSTTVMQVMFFGFAGLMGALISMYLHIYTPESVLRAFLMASSLFVGMSLYGYTTKKDLSGIGKIAVVGMLAVVVTSLINVFFFKSTIAEMVMSAIVVALSAGITAWTTQDLRRMYAYAAQSQESMQRMAIMGALTLYVNFINMFLALLRLFGNRN